MKRKLPFGDPARAPALVELAAKAFIQHQDEETSSSLEWYAQLRSRYPYGLCIHLFGILQQYENKEQQIVQSETDVIDLECPHCQQSNDFTLQTSWTLTSSSFKHIDPEQLVIDVDVR